MGSLKSYVEYKEIDLPWLQSIPSNWMVGRNKLVMKPKKNRVGETHKSMVLLSLTKQGIIARDMVGLKGKYPSDFDAYQAVQDGDIIFCLFDIDETPRAVGLSKLNGMITGAYSVFEIEGVNKSFLYYYYIVIDNNKLLKPYYKGLRKVVNVDTFLRLKLPLPPKEEQDQIVRYLDSKLAKINKFIKNKKRLIELLKEQKQAVINQAVTKGLDPDAKMKPSGVEWLGDVPEGWDILYLFQTAKNQRISNKLIKNNNRLSLSYGKIVARDINSTDGLLPTSFDTYQVVKDGNIILRLTDLHNDHTSLRVGLVTQEGIITSAYTCLKVGTERIIPSYMYLLLHVYDIRKVFYGMGSGVRQSMSFADIKKLPLCIPPIQEQQDIIKGCNKATNTIDNQVALINKEISLITEYRTSLISAVVTGKVDVRGIVVEEPPVEDLAELEPAELEADELQEDNLLESEVN